MAFIEGKAQPNFGDVLGGQLQRALGQIGQVKMQQMMQRHQQSLKAKGLESALGLKPEEAMNAAGLPDTVLAQYAKQKMLEPTYQNYGNQLNQLLGGGGQAANAPMPNPGMGGSSAGGIPNLGGGLLPNQATDLANLYLKKQKLEQDQQNRKSHETEVHQTGINKQYKEYLSDLKKSYEGATEIRDKAKKALKLVQSGKTRAGIAGLLPLGITGADPATRQLATLYEEIAGKKAAEATGPMSKARIMMAQRQKASLDMPREAQEALLKQYIQDAESKPIELYNIGQEIIKANGNRIPEGFDALVHQEYAKRHPENVEGSDEDIASITGQQPDRQYDASNENLLESILRKGIGGTAQVAKGAVTGLGNIAQLGANVTDLAANAAGLNPDLSGKLEKYSPLPTSESVDKALSKATGGYTDPKGGGEKFMYDILETFGSIASPAAAAGKVATGLSKLGLGASKAATATKYILPFSGYSGSASKALAASAAGHGAKELTATLGGGSTAQTVAQTAAMLAAGTAGTRKAINEEAKALFKNAKEGFADTFQDATPIMKNLLEIKHTAIRQAHPYSKQVGEIVDEIVSGINKNRHMHPVTDLIASAKNINSRYGWSTHERIPGGKFTPPEIRPELGEIVKVLDKGIARAGMMNPSAAESAKNYLMAKDLWKGLNTYGNIAHFFIDNADISAAFASNHSWPSTVFNLVKGGLGYAGRDLAKVGSLFKHPSGREAYLGALKAAAKNNRNAFIQQMNKLSKIARKEGLD